MEKTEREADTGTEANEGEKQTQMGGERNRACWGKLGWEDGKII